MKGELYEVSVESTWYVVACGERVFLSNKKGRFERSNFTRSGLFNSLSKRGIKPKHLISNYNV
jgi:hypothetical protein